MSNGTVSSCQRTDGDITVAIIKGRLTSAWLLVPSWTGYPQDAHACCSSMSPGVGSPRLGSNLSHFGIVGNRPLSANGDYSAEAALMPRSRSSPRQRQLLTRLVSARSAAGLSQVGLAARLKRPQSFVSKYESGERRLDVIEFVEICEILAVDPANILRGLIALDA
jgi:DNA-binding transcriptional regulator YiaG